MSTIADNEDTDLDLEIAGCDKLLNGVPCPRIGSAECKPGHNVLSGKCNKISDFSVNCDISNSVENSEQGIASGPVLHVFPSGNLELSSDTSQNYNIGKSSSTQCCKDKLIGNFNQTNHFCSEDELSLFAESDLDSVYSMDEFEEKQQFKLNKFSEKSHMGHSASSPPPKRMRVFENAADEYETIAPASSHFDTTADEIPALELSFTEQKMLKDELNRPVTPTKSEEDILLLCDDSDFDDLYVCDEIESTDDYTDGSLSECSVTNNYAKNDDLIIQESRTDVHICQEVENEETSNEALEVKSLNCDKSHLNDKTCVKYKQTEASNALKMKAHVLADAYSNIIHESDPFRSLKLTPSNSSCNLEESSSQDSGFYDTIEGLDHDRSKVDVTSIDNDSGTIVEIVSSDDAQVATTSSRLSIGASTKSKVPESISPQNIVVRTRAFLRSLPKRDDALMQSDPSTSGRHRKLDGNNTNCKISIKDKYADETEDIKGWQNMRELTTDKERYEQVRTFWQSNSIPDPTKNLTYHSYRRRHVKTNDVSSRVSKQHKRQATDDINPNKPKRSKRCTYFIDDMIDSVKAEMADTKLSLDREKDTRIISEISEFQSYMARYPNNDDKRDLWTRHSNRLEQINWEHSTMVEKQIQGFSERQRKLQDARKEMVQFYRFYKGLHTADPKVDPTFLTDSQNQEMTEILRIYDFFDTIYK